MYAFLCCFPLFERGVCLAVRMGICNGELSPELSMRHQPIANTGLNVYQK